MDKVKYLIRTWLESAPDKQQSRPYTNEIEANRDFDILHRNLRVGQTIVLEDYSTGTVLRKESNANI